MVPAGNQAKRPSLINHTAETVNHHHRHHHHHHHQDMSPSHQVWWP